MADVDDPGASPEKTAPPGAADSYTLIPVYNSPHINGIIVPLVDSERIQITDYTDGMIAYFVPGDWIHRSLGLPTVPFGGTVLGNKFRNAFKCLCGKHTRNTWYVDKDGKPFGDTVSVTVDGFTFTILPSIKTLAIQYSKTSLQQFAWCVLKNANMSESSHCVAAANTTDTELSAAIQTSLSDKDLDELRSYRIRWQPSKMLFLYGPGGKYKYSVKSNRMMKSLSKKNHPIRIRMYSKCIKKAKTTLCKVISARGEIDEPIGISDVSMSEDGSSDTDS